MIDFYIGLTGAWLAFAAIFGRDWWLTVGMSFMLVLMLSGGLA